MRLPTGLSYILGLLRLVTVSKAESICSRLFHGYDLIHHNLRCTYLGSEIDSNCRIDITAIEEHIAAADLTNLTQNGYRLCFGCGSRAVSHCSRVAICTKESHARHTLSQRKMVDCQFDNDRTRYYIAFKRDNSAGTRQWTKLGYFIAFKRDNSAGSTQGKELSSHNRPSFTQKCYRHTGQDPGTYSYGCCDSTCSDIQCFSTCEGNFCNADQSQINYINRLLSMGQTTTAIPGTGFSDWSTWSTCTAPCGTTGIQLRTRVCLPGRTCMGSTQENAACTADPCAHTGASTTRTSPNPATATEASSMRTMAISTSVPCEDTLTGLQGTCNYWQNFDVCKPDNAAYLTIGKLHCRKTCGICS